MWKNCTGTRVFASQAPSGTAAKARSVLAIAVVILLCSFPESAQQSAAAAPDPAKQDSEKSLADTAREARKTKAVHAKKQITDDDVVTKRSPLPSLNLDGDDNSEEVILAIGDFEAKHTPEETEQAVHDWYDQYDSMLTNAARENVKTGQRRAATTYDAYLACQDSSDYQACAARQRAENRGAHDDQTDMRNNGAVIGRIQQSFMKIRGGIVRYKLQYSWFKIRNGNGNGSF